MGAWLKIIITTLILIIMSQNTSASVWVDDIEVGLAPHQSSGYVENNFIIRSENSNIENIYIEATEIEIMHHIEGHQKIKVNGNEFYFYSKVNFDIGI